MWTQMQTIFTQNFIGMATLKAEISISSSFKCKEPCGIQTQRKTGKKYSSPLPQQNVCHAASLPLQIS